MKKRYEFIGSLPFLVEEVDEHGNVIDGSQRWVDPTGGGFITAALDPARESFFVKAGLIREAPAPKAIQPTLKE